MHACRFIVTGKVQGVFFGASTRDEARRLGVRGHVKNLQDGSVEVIAAGEAAAVESLAAWLQHGPQMAQVATVYEAELGTDAQANVKPGDFRIASCAN